MILGSALALGPDENTAPLVSMYRRLVVVAGRRCRTVSIVGIAAGFHCQTRFWGQMEGCGRLIAVGVKHPAVDKPASGSYYSPYEAMLAL